MFKQLFCVVAAVLISSIVVGGVAVGAVYSVDTVDVAVLNQAITDANNNPGLDTVQINAAGVYSGDIVWPVDAITIESTVAGVVIEKSAGAGQVLRCDPGGSGTSGRTDVFTIRGASEEAKLTIRNSINGVPIINTGPDALTDYHYVVLENVVLERPTSGGSSVGSFINFNNACVAPHQLVNVDFVGAATDNFLAVAALGAAPTGMGAILDNCTFDQAQGTAVRVQTSSPAVWEVTLTNCLISSSGSIPASAIIGLSSSVVHAIDCTFQTNGARAIYPGNIAEDFTVEVVRPTFAGNSGDIFFWCPANFSVNYTIAGDVDDKFDVGDFYAVGGALFSRVLNGAMNFVNCTATGYGIFDAQFEGPGQYPLTVTMDRCYWEDGAGIITFADGVLGTMDPVMTDQPWIFAATNTVWTGNYSGQGHLVSTNDLAFNPTTEEWEPTRTSQASQTYVHCTMNAAGCGVLCQSVGETLDTITGYYSIFDASDTLSGQASGANTLLGQSNLTFGGAAGDSAFGMGEPGDTLRGDPLLDAQAFPSNSSAALGAAVGSAVVVDVLGIARPMPAENWPDIGAYEEQTVDVRPSYHSGWSLYE